MRGLLYVPALGFARPTWIRAEIQGPASAPASDESLEAVASDPVDADLVIAADLWCGVSCPDDLRRTRGDSE